MIVQGEMCVVARIIGEMATGVPGWSVMRGLEAGRVPSPSGISRWNQRTIANLVANDLYRPHSLGEVAEMVEPQVAATLEEGRVYGLWSWGRRKTREWRERAEGGGFVTRYAAQLRPEEEWLRVPVDVTDAGLDRAAHDRAREVAKDRYKKPSTAAGRFWELRGIACCGECGAVMGPHTVKRKRADGSVRQNLYYRCRKPWSNGPRTCDHTRAYTAEGLEQLVWDEIFGLISHPDRLRREHERHVERLRREMRGNPDREATALAEKLAKLERRRGGLLDLAADGLMDREELRGKLAEVDLQRGELEEALRSARNRQQSIREFERKWSIAGSMLALQPPTYATAGPEDRRRIYQALMLEATIEQDGAIALSGIFDPAIRLIDLVTGPPLDTGAPLPKPLEGSRVVVTSRNTSPPV